MISFLKNSLNVASFLTFKILPFFKSIAGNIFCTNNKLERITDIPIEFSGVINLQFNNLNNIKDLQKIVERKIKMI